MKAYAKCTKCERYIDHWLDICANPEKYDKSTKAMESTGAVKTVLSIRKECPNAYLVEIVMDEYLTTRFKLSHSKSELIAAGRTMEEER